MPAFAQFLLNLRSALSNVSFSLTITLDISENRTSLRLPFSCGFPADTMPILIAGLCRVKHFFGLGYPSVTIPRSGKAPNCNVRHSVRPPRNATTPSAFSFPFNTSVRIPIWASAIAKAFPAARSISVKSAVSSISIGSGTLRT